MMRLVAALVLSASTLAQAPTDAQLRAEVQKKISGLKVGGKVTVAVENHIAMVDGMVPTLWAKRQVIDAALKTPGIEKVQSTIAIAKGENDEQLAAEVARTIQGYAHYTVYDYIDGNIKNAVVSLTGAITTEQKLDELTERVEKIRGVQDLDNKIKVLPVSPSDDQIRFTIANQIYRDPQFRQYSLANPPIHVVVDRGRVTLIGIVSAELERQKAYEIARSVPGVFNVDNQVKLKSELR